MTNTYADSNLTVSVHSPATNSVEDRLLISLNTAKSVCV